MKCIQFDLLNPIQRHLSLSPPLAAAKDFRPKKAPPTRQHPPGDRSVKNSFRNSFQVDAHILKIGATATSPWNSLGRSGMNETFTFVGSIRGGSATAVTICTVDTGSSSLC
jgi:hypothetical protein